MSSNMQSSLVCSSEFSWMLSYSSSMVEICILFLHLLKFLTNFYSEDFPFLFSVVVFFIQLLISFLESIAFFTVLFFHGNHVGWDKRVPLYFREFIQRTFLLKAIYFLSYRLLYLGVSVSVFLTGCKSSFSVTSIFTQKFSFWLQRIYHNLYTIDFLCRMLIGLLFRMLQFDLSVVQVLKRWTIMSHVAPENLQDSIKLVITVSHFHRILL